MSGNADAKKGEGEANGKKQEQTFFHLHRCSPLPQLLGFSVKSVLFAEAAELVELESVGVVLLVLFCVVISLLALGADQSNLDSCVISHFFRHLPFQIFGRSR